MRRWNPRHGTSHRWQVIRKQAALDLARQLQFLLHALLFTLLLEQARIFENSGGFERERLKNLAVPGGEVRGSIA